MENEHTFVSFKEEVAEVVDNLYRWQLEDLIIKGYEANILPDGTIDKKVLIELKRIAKNMLKLTKESKAKRRDRWFRHILCGELFDIRGIMTNLHNIAKAYGREKDEVKCKGYQEPTSKPCQQSCPIHPDSIQT